jgi:PAS domain S-box-containing protein
MTPDMVCIASREGYFKKVNQSVIRKLEYTQEELFSRPIHTFIHEEDKEETARTRVELINGKPLINFQNRYISKTGKIVWMDWTSIYFPDVEVVFAIAKDVTERKEMERELVDKYREFKSLATHFKSSMERDRKHLAVELHEELAQLASVVKMDIDWLHEHSTDQTAASKKTMEHALGVSEMLIKALRRISYSISPNMLYDVGLDDTLKWLCDEFSIVNGMPCFYDCHCDTTALSQEIQVDIFRICQESLSNVMYHAEASEVRIKIEIRGTSLFLTITDDGKGFEIDEEDEASGLSSLKKRAASINGTLDIYSEIGKGTKIIFMIEQAGIQHDALTA